MPHVVLCALYIANWWIYNLHNSDDCPFEFQGICSMGDVELPKCLFRIGCEPEGRKRINNYFTLRWIEIIKSALDQAHLKQLEGSQFGSLLKIGKHQFSVMFLHYILSRQLVTDKKYEMWWVFAGKPIWFCIDDFALVTGLNCSKSGFNKKAARTRGMMKAVQNPTRFY